jgi:geranylgeranyl diphosphate synthase type I
MIMGIIDEVLAEDWMNPFTAEMVRYQLDSGGKRIRPALVLGIHRAFGGADAGALHFAAAVELIHNASLVHDDIQDQDEQRRGRKAAWKEYSTSQAINLGDILFSIAFEVFMRSSLGEGTKFEVVKLAMRAVEELVNGQVQELIYRRTFQVTPEDYFGMVGGKTGSLFRLASKGACMLTENGSDAWRSDLGRLGSCLGNMFQVRDDIIDIFGLKEGRSPGCDIMEGKVSILTSISLMRLRGSERASLVDMLGVPREEKDAGLVGTVIDVYRKTGAFREAFGLYEKEKERMFSIPLMMTNEKLGAFMKEIVDHISVPLQRLSCDF